MATPLICLNLKTSPENVKQLSVITSSVKRRNVSVEGSLMVALVEKVLLKCQKPFIVRNNGILAER